MDIFYTTLSLGMSKLWVGLFSGSNKNFVSPLIESLRHDMTLKTSISLKTCQILL